jgi:hypothetical protein
MSLTGVPLFVCAFLATAAALAGTILAWNRWRRLRFVLRPFGVLLTEALLVVSVGLVVNRSEQFYPDWDALLRSSNAGATTYAVHPGGLDGWLHQTGDLADQGDAFPWQPAGWTDWRLAAAPLVFTPAGYLTHTGWRYPALLVIDDGKTPWTAATETAAARSADGTAGPAIVVFARTTAATGADTLTAALPAALAHDLRVTDRHWALVASAADTGLANQVVAAAPGRYPALVLVKPATKTTPAKKPAAKTPAGKTPAAKTPAAKKPAAKKPAAKPKTASKPGVKTTPAKLPAGIITTTVVETAFTTGSVNPPGPAGESALAAALDWACRQTPPPLAASTPAAKSLPVYHSHHHPKRPAPGGSGLPSAGAGASDPRGGKRVTR